MTNYIHCFADFTQPRYLPPRYERLHRRNGVSDRQQERQDGAPTQAGRQKPRTSQQ